jgi:Family of unknown function (DUF5631)/Family of unknown function (DUF5632)
MTSGGVGWRQILVGQWLTPESDLALVNSAAIKRQATAAAWHHFSEQLTQQLSGPLSPDIQKGMAADNIRGIFQSGASQARDVGDTNGVISKANGSAHEAVTSLNSRLNEIASDGESRIQQIQQSKDLVPIKVGKIVEVVMDCQGQANSAAAPCTQNVFEAMQTILDQRGIHMSARQFAQACGLDTTGMVRSPNESSIRQQVTSMLDNKEGGANPPPVLGKGDAPIQQPNNPVSQPLPPATVLGAKGTPVGDSGGTPAGQAPVLGSAGVPAPQATAGSGLSKPGGLGNLPSPNAPLTSTGLQTGSPTSAMNPAAIASGPQPSALAQGLNPSLNQVAPMSAATNNVAPVTGPVQPQAPTQPTMSEFSGPTVPATAHAPAVDTSTPAPAAPPTIVSHTSITDSSTTYLAGPTASAPSAPAAPAGPLPTYGSDIRPPAPTISAPTIPSSPSGISSVSSAASPASAPVSPSAGAGGLAQPVVRQPTVTAVTHAAPAGIGEQAVVATAGGAAAGAASATAAAKARLQRLVDFVASQEPRLRWAAGEQPDGTTILVTDLASGWIPPEIAIPSVLTLLGPGDRRGDLETLLGEVSASVSYTPLHYLPESPNDGEPIPSSLRPRQVPAVDELGWELGQATKWRDGLPMMAHTLAKAASSGISVEGNEAEFLDQHLAMLRDRVLDAYPDDVDAAAVANWQLLASINALAAADTVGANYHFAWFQALNRVP